MVLRFPFDFDFRSRVKHEEFCGIVRQAGSHRYLVGKDDPASEVSLAVKVVRGGRGEYDCNQERRVSYGLEGFDLPPGDETQLFQCQQEPGNQICDDGDPFDGIRAQRVSPEEYDPFQSGRFLLLGVLDERTGRIPG